MEIKVVGGEPEYAVMGGVHGDEPCGKKAIERFLESEPEFRKGVKFVIANEEALEKEVRYLEADLNRSFPGDPESKRHEERLAARIMEELKGLKLLDLHTTRSYPRPFANFKRNTEEVISLVRSAGVSNAMYRPDGNGSSTSHVERSVVVETGLQGTEAAVENGLEVIRNFLASEGVIDAEYARSDPEIYRYVETVRGEGYEFLADNFEKVEKGEIYAEKDGEKLRADRDFYPVLMSTNGYENMLGFKAEKL